MKLVCKGIIVVFFIQFSINIGIAQTGSISKVDSIPKIDSTNTALVQEFNKKLIEIEKQRVQDSIRKAKLEQELQSLKTTDNLKKDELQQQLQALREKELNRIEEKKERIAKLRETSIGYPVTGFFNDTLFLIYNKLGSFSPKDRALAISDRIKNLGESRQFDEAKMTIENAETTVDITYGESIIMSVSENDALWSETDNITLATNLKKIILDTIINYQNETSWITLAKEFGLAILVLIILCTALWYVSKFFNWLEKYIRSQNGKAIKGVRIKNYVLFDATRQVVFLTYVNSIIKWGMILFLVYIALPIIFGFFPWTQGFAQTLFGYILNPLKSMATSVWNYMPNLFTILVIFGVFRYILKGVHFLKDEIEEEKLHIPGFYPDWANPTFQILRVLLLAFMFILVFPYLPGSDSPIFQGVSVFLGFLFTFGSAGSLSNIIAGIVLTYMRLFKIGDRVKIGSVTGDVIEKSMLVTRIKTTKNEIISIPNSTVMSSHTINYSSESTGNGLILHSTVTIGYDVPWRKVHEALITAANRTTLLEKEPKPFVLQTSLDDFYVSYQINAYTKEPNKQAGIYSELHQHIQDCCNEVGIEILSPHYRAARDGSMLAVPPEYIPKDYVVPPFNIKVQKDQ
uniref:mechanosensitive ion channel domain-containing protein n=1 Tax=Fulvivirga sp. TaxID=1931237 RepID=UPI0040491644